MSSGLHASWDRTGPRGSLSSWGPTTFGIYPNQHVTREARAAGHRRNGAPLRVEQFREMQTPLASRRPRPIGRRPVKKAMSKISARILQTYFEDLEHVIKASVNLAKEATGME